MATTACRDCEKDVSGGATTCPHCGAKKPSAKHPPGWLAKRVLLGLVGVWVLIRVLTPDGPAPTSAGPAVTVPDTVQCAFNRSDGKLLGRVLSLAPSTEYRGHQVAQVKLDASLGGSAGELTEVTIPRNGTMGDCP